MCKYAMVAYKTHHACFSCRKTFKRRLLHDVARDEKESVDAKCPQCGQLMASMGYDFPAPKKGDSKAWEQVQRLYSVGIRYDSCGCSGPGYIPATKEQLIAYFEDIIREYQRHLNFWRQRTEPQNSRELDREKSKKGYFLIKVPRSLGSKRGFILNEDAKQYWIGRLKEVEQKLELITTTASNT